MISCYSLKQKIQPPIRHDLPRDAPSRCKRQPRQYLSSELATITDVTVPPDGARYGSPTDASADDGWPLTASTRQCEASCCIEITWSWISSLQGRNTFDEHCCLATQGPWRWQRTTCPTTRRSPMSPRPATTKSCHDLFPVDQQRINQPSASTDTRKKIQTVARLIQILS